MAEEIVQTFMLNNVRVSFPYLWEPYVDEKRKLKDPEYKGKYSAKLLLDKEEHADLIEQLMEAAHDHSKRWFKKVLSAERFCLRDGDNSDRDEENGYYTLSASNNRQPLVINTKGDDIVRDQDSDKIYAGCRVNVKISFWKQDNTDGGKRVNANLLAIQFNGDDEPFTSGLSVTDTMAGFGAVSGSDLLG